MGQVFFYEETEGISAGSCFDRLVEECIEERGHNSYNGTLSTCDLLRVKHVADIYTKEASKKGREIAENDTTDYRREAIGLDLGVVGYEVITVKKYLSKKKEPAKFATKYVVFREDGKEAGFFDTKTEADQAATAQILKDPDCEYVVCRRPVKINKGSDVASEFMVTRKMYNKRPKTVRKGQTVREIHRFAFYGWASE